MGDRKETPRAECVFTKRDPSSGLDVPSTKYVDRPENDGVQVDISKYVVELTKLSHTNRMSYGKKGNSLSNGIDCTEHDITGKDRTPKSGQLNSEIKPKVQSNLLQTSKGNFSLDRPNMAKDWNRFHLMLQEVVNDSRARNGSQSLISRKHRMNRQHFIAALHAACCTPERPASFHSVPVVRKQLQAEFIHLHYAKEGEDWYPTKLILLRTSDTASFSAATNALYLTQLATSNNDQKLLRNAMRSYQGALHLLRKDLSRPKAHLDDSLFATIHMMSLCEAFNGISLDDSGRRQHTNGMEMLFQSRGPSSIQDMYMMIQLQQHQQKTLLDGLVSRKRPLVGEGAWLGVHKKCCLKLTELTTLALRVPGALEDADAICSKGSSAPLEGIMELLSDFKSLERDLHTWMAEWCARYNGLPYWKVPISSHSWLPQHIRSESTPFYSALQFPMPVCAKAHALLWMPLLALRQAIRDVVELHPFPLIADTLPIQRQRLHDEIAECADNLCMTAIFLMSPGNGVEGYMEACGPLLLASIWYEKDEDFDKLAWCRRVFQHIESRGIRTPGDSQRSRIMKAKPP